MVSRRTGRSGCGSGLLAGLLAGLLLPGCSLLGFDDFVPYTCASDDDCAALDEADGIREGDCEHWQCPGDNNTSACVLRARDDDDDGVAACGLGPLDCDDSDPRVTSASAEWTFATVATLPDRERSLRWVDVDAGLAVLHPGADGTPRVTYPGLDASRSVPALTEVSAHGLPLAEGCVQSAFESTAFPTTPIVGAVPGVTCEAHADCQDGVTCNGAEICQPDSPAADAMGCREASVDACSGEGRWCDERVGACAVTVSGACSLSELAAADVGDGRWMGVGVSQTGCADGQLRVGWLAPSAEASWAEGLPGAGFATRGDRSRAPGYDGIDVGAEANEACTGSSREGGPLGVSAPAIAALLPEPAEGRDRPQALAVWQAAPRTRAFGGGGGAVGVEALGLFFEEVPADGGTLRWVAPTDGGQPLSLSPEATGASAPAVASHAGIDGYVVAYPAFGGGLAVHVIAAAADPAEVSEAPPFSSLVEVSGASRSTPALPSPRSAVIDAASTVERVRIAIGGAGPELALAWVAGEQACVAVSSVEGIGDATGCCEGSGVSALDITATDDGFLLVTVDAEGAHLTAIDADGERGPASLIHPETGLEHPAVRVRGRTARVGFARGDVIEVGAHCL